MWGIATRCRTCRPRSTARRRLLRCRRRSLPSRDDTRVDDGTATRDGFEEHPVALDLDERERIVGIESLRGHRRVVAEISPAQLRGPTLYEVIDPLLRLQPFVQVLVPSENHV